MDSREVIKSLFAGQGITRMGLRDVPWPETSVTWLKQGYPTAPQKYIDDYYGFDKFAEFGLDAYPEDAIEHFQMDLTKCGFYWDVLPIKGYREVLEEDERSILVRNGGGAALRSLKVLSGCPEHVDFTMTSQSIWEKDYKPHLRQTDPGRINAALMRDKFDQRRKEGKFIYFSTMFVWESLRSCLGDICLYESMVLEPEWIHDFCRTYTDFYKRHMTLAFEQVGTPDAVLLLEDLGYKHRLFCSPQTYAELIFPYYAEIVAFLHEKGISCMLHSCGCVTQALELIEGAGFDLLNPMEVKAGCDIYEIARRYKDKFVLMGGMDARILETGDLPLIRKETEKLVTGMKRLGVRYIFGSDHSLSSNVTYDAFACAVDTYRKHMWY